ncbi:hypothetical protein Tco_0045068 [Tanacetum coccineum]
MSSFNQLNCFGCGEPIDDLRCRWCTCEKCGYDLRDGFCLFCNSRDGNSFAYDPNPNSFDLSDYPPQPQYQTYSCELCGNDAHYGYDCPPQVLFHAQPEDIQELLHKLLKDLQIIREELAEYINCPSWNHLALYDDDDEYTIQYREYLENSSKPITPDLPTEEPDNSLSMCDVPFCNKNHFDAECDLMESLLNRDTSIVYSPKIDSLLEEFAGELAPINPIPPGINKDDFDPKEDIRLVEQLLYDNSPPLDALKDHFEIFFNFNDDSTSSDDDSFEDIDYVEASPPDSELVSLEEVKDDILHEKLLNIYVLIAKIEYLNDNPTLDCVLKSPSLFSIPVEDSDSFFEKSDTSLSYSNNSLPEFETFSDHMEETSSGSTTTHADISLPKYDSFHFEIDPDQGELTRVMVEDICDNSTRELYVNVLPTLPTLKDRHYLFHTYVIQFFLPYFTYPVESPFLLSSGSEDTIFDPGIFAFHFSSLEPAASHRSGTFICFNDCPDFEDSRAHGLVHSYTRASYSQLHLGNPISKSYRLTAPSKIKEIHVHILLEADMSDTKRPRWRSRALSLVELTWHQSNGQDVMIWRQLGLDGYDWKRGERPEG